MQILHNPRCRKSRETLQILNEAGIEPEIIEYLRNPPSVPQLKKIISKLGLKPQEIIRKGEMLYKQTYKGKDLSDEQWIEVMAENPILIERPIVISGEMAVLGRPPENVRQLID